MHIQMENFNSKVIYSINNKEINQVMKIRKLIKLIINVTCKEDWRKIKNIYQNKI
jgi:hypothetical protein